MNSQNTNGDKEHNYLVNMYNATCTDDSKGELETYPDWLERQLLSRIDKVDTLTATLQELQRENEELKDQIDKLREYVDHKDDCDLRMKRFTDFTTWCKENPNADWVKAHREFMNENKLKTCTCGLSELLNTK